MKIFTIAALFGASAHATKSIFTEGDSPCGRSKSFVSTFFGNNMIVNYGELLPVSNLSRIEQSLRMKTLISFGMQYNLVL